jgi:hypothetical protein
MSQIEVEPRGNDQRVILCGASWKAYQALLAIRGDRANVRLY